MGETKEVGVAVVIQPGSDKGVGKDGGGMYQQSGGKQWEGASVHLKQIMKKRFSMGKTH